MSYSAVNDLAKAMKALDGKETCQTWHASIKANKSARSTFWVSCKKLKKAENMEWQIAGPRADQHISLKTELSKSLEKLSNLHVGQ